MLVQKALTLPGAESGNVADYLKSSDVVIKKSDEQISNTDSEEEKLEEKAASEKLASMVNAKDSEEISVNQTPEQEIEETQNKNLPVLERDKSEEKLHPSLSELEQESEEEDLSDANEKLKQLLGGDD